MRTVGIDEVGRGCWAGPLVAGAVILSEPIIGLKDSKKLSSLQRNRLATRIREQAAAMGLGWVWPREIDERGLTWAVRAAMERALTAIVLPYDDIIIDGNINYLSNILSSRSIIKADESVAAVSAASIIAKVARDEYMSEIGNAFYPEYEFAAHVGYGTRRHKELLTQHGVTPEHRYSYKPIRALLELSYE